MGNRDDTGARLPFDLILDALRRTGARVGDEQRLETGSDSSWRSGATSEDTVIVDRDAVLSFLPGDQELRVRPGSPTRIAIVSPGSNTVEPRLIRVNAGDVATWHTIAPEDLALAARRRPRLLLLIHGPISSTIGTFGQLSLTVWGRALLAAWEAAYDAVLGFDHDTIARDPLQNAQELLELLRSVAAAPLIDVVAHSRGGLVLESLSTLAAGDRTGPQIARGTLVASPNAGTPLAADSRRLELAALLANLTAATGLGMSTIGPTPTADLVSLAALSGLAALLDSRVTGIAPGLTAMQPGSDLLAELAERERAHKGPLMRELTAIAGASAPAWSTATHSPREMPASLARELSERAQAFTDGPGDLVVPLASMTSMDPQAETQLADIYTLGSTPVVHHLNYLTRPEVTTALDRWQRVSERAGAPGVSAGIRVPAQVNDRITVIGTGDDAHEASARLIREDPDLVVVRGAVTDAYTVHDVGAVSAELTKAGTDGAAVEDALDPAPTAPTMTANAAAGESPPPGSHVVALAGGEPIGVVEPPPSSDAIALSTAQELTPTESAPAPVRRGARRRTRGGTATGAAWPVVSPADSPAPEASAAGSSMPGDAAPPPPPRGPPGQDPSTGSGGPDEGVTIHAQAQLDRILSVGAVGRLRVDVAREQLSADAGGQLSSLAEGRFAQAPVIVEVTPIRGVELAGPGRAEIELPGVGAPQHLYFDIRATTAGEAELWVVLRQGILPAITLKLMPSVSAEEVGATSRSSMVVADRGPTNVDNGIHQLLEITDYGDGKLRFRLTPDPSGVPTDYEQDIPDKCTRERYAHRIYERIEAQWRESSDAATFQALLQEYGNELFEELLPIELRRVLWEHRTILDGAFVLSDEPMIPWELVHLRPPDGPMPAEPCFLGQFGLVRWLRGFPYPPAQLVVNAGRSRYIIPRYADPQMHLPATERERLFLEREFQAQPVGAELMAVRSFLTDPDPADFLHFSGHGVASGDVGRDDVALLLQGRERRRAGVTDYPPEMLTARTVNTWLHAADGRPLVVLNACQTGRLRQRLTSIGGFAVSFLKGGAGAFVASLWSVGDAPAADFTCALYERLLDAEPMSDAIRGARKDAREAGDGTWLAYAVYAHPAAILVRA